VQNYALFHCIGPSIQTALFNAPLAVIVSWGLGKTLDLNFEIFMIVLLVMSILVVGNFLRDGSSNYLEGCLLVVSWEILGEKQGMGTDVWTDCICDYCTDDMVLSECRVDDK
jgi:calcium/proton exchanger cax